jgi:hypothetical protein
MKFPSVSLALLSLVVSLSAQETRADEGRALLLGEVVDGTPSATEIEPVLPDFKVVGSTVKRLADHDIVLNQVEDPGLAPLPGSPEQEPLDLNDPEAAAWLERETAEAPEHRLVMLSATVYDHQKTFLRWRVVNPKPDGALPLEDFQAWSNLDFNLFSGVSSYEYRGVTYSLIMGIGNQETAQSETPELPVGEPAFVITEGNQGEAEQMALIEGLHELYSNEKEILDAAYLGREQAEAERRAHLEANPPQPEDVVIHFWRGKRTEANR